MKIMKNKFFKIASLMIMLCLISTCAIGTTFAKYVTGDTATDSARVAKWGVRLTMQGDDLFRNTYAADDTEITGKLSVQSSSTDKVVAPGTKGSTVFSISGIPEVAVRIVIDFNATSDIVLPAGAVLADDSTLAANYHPLVFTLKQLKDANGDIAAENQTLKSGTLADIQEFLDTYTGTNGAEYEPNTNLASTYELSWAWAFENAGMDAADTLLGDIIAGVEPANGAVTSVQYDLSITVTQID